MPISSSTSSSTAIGRFGPKHVSNGVEQRAKRQRVGDAPVRQAASKSTSSVNVDEIL
jgi:hypothetical protein